MGEKRYVCEPHYDENGNFDYWNPLFPYRRDTCEGCKYDEEGSARCEDCYRIGFDYYEPKVVE